MKGKILMNITFHQLITMLFLVEAPLLSYLFFGQESLIAVSIVIGIFCILPFFSEN